MLGIGDQVVSSGSNFALNILIVRSVATDAYGAFALAFAIYTLFRGATQAVIAQPLLVRHTRHLTDPQSIDDHRGAYRHALAGAFELGLVGGIAVAIGGYAVGGDLRTSLLALAVTLPGLTMQEAMRSVYFAQGRPLAAIAIDSAWAVTQLVLVGGLLVAGSTQVGWLILVWGASGGLSVVVAMAVERLPMALRGSWRWLVGLKDLSWPFFGEIMTALLATQGVLLVLSSVAGLDAVGTFRSAQVLFSPLNVLITAMTMVGIPEAVRLLRTRPERFLSTIVIANAALTLAVCAWCVAVIAMPDSLGEALLGQSWSQASAILPQSSLFYVASAIAVGALVSLRALQAARASLIASVVGSLVTFAFGCIGAAQAGASGAALGLGFGAGIIALAQWVAYRLVTRAGNARGRRPAALHAPAQGAEVHRPSEQEPHAGDLRRWTMGQRTNGSGGLPPLRRPAPVPRRITAPFVVGLVVLVLVTAVAIASGLDPVLFLVAGAGVLVAPFVGRALRHLGANDLPQAYALAAMYAALFSTLVLRVRSATDIADNPLDNAGQFRVLMLGVAGMLACASLVLSRGRRLPLPPRSFILFAGYVFAAGIAVLMATHPGLAVFRFGELTVFVLVAYVTYMAFGRQVSVPIRNVMWFVYVLLGTTIVGLFLDTENAWQEAYQADRLKGVYPHLSANVIGLLGSVCVAYGLGRRRIHWLPVIAGVGFAAAAQHRTGLMAIAAVILVRLLFARRNTAVVVAMVIMGLTLTVATVGVADQLWSRGQKTAEVSTLSSRTEWWDDGLRALGRSPLNGLGLSSGSRYEVFASIKSNEDTPNLHGTWLEALVGAGILGGAMLLAAFVSSMVAAVRCGSRHRYLLPLLFLVALGVNSLTHSTIEFASIVTLIFLYAGIDAVHPPPDPTPAVPWSSPASVEWTTSPSRPPVRRG